MGHTLRDGAAGEGKDCRCLEPEAGVDALLRVCRSRPCAQGQDGRDVEAQLTLYGGLYVCLLVCLRFFTSGASDGQ